MEYIDHIYYINLNQRKDRMLSIETQLKIFNLKGERIEATFIKDFPAKGCTSSHIKCITNAIENNYKNILILEDDFIFVMPQDEFENKLKYFFNIHKDWNVLLLNGSHVKSKKSSEYFSKIIKSSSTCGYMVNCHYYKKLFLNYTNSYDNIKKNSIDNYAIDKGWQSLQKTDNWYIFDPLAGYQDSSYSDIEKKFTNYFNQKYILCNLKGELGNQLFQIANAYYLSKKYGKKLIVSNDNPELNKLYHEIEKNLLQNNFETENVSEKEFKYNEIILDRNKNTIIEGFFHSELYFSTIKKEISQLFYLNKEDSEKLKILKSKYGIDKNSISLHIMRGDDTIHDKLLSNIPLYYYEECIKYFGTNNRYIIFSDNISWCKNKDIFINLPNKIFVEEKNINYLELCLISSCTHNIIANSTFSWWGAYLNKNPNKIVMTPNRWYNINTEDYETTNIIPKEWKIINITDITFVTSYFNKESFDSIKNTLNMNYPFIIFILKDDIDARKNILKIRKNHLSMTLIIEVNVKYSNQKPNFLSQAVINNPFNSEIFFWVDIDYIKIPFYYSGIIVEKIPKDKLLVSDTENTLRFFGGYNDTVIMFNDIYYKYIRVEQNIPKIKPDIFEVIKNKNNDETPIFTYLNTNDTNKKTYDNNYSLSSDIPKNKKGIYSIIIILIAIILLGIFFKLSKWIFWIFLICVVIYMCKTYINYTQHKNDSKDSIQNYKINVKILNKFINNNIAMNKIDIPIYYINLDRSPDRKKNMEDQFKKYNITNFNRISGIDGKLLTNPLQGSVDGMKFTNNYKNMSKNEVGCLLSHVKAIITAYKNGLDEVLILEDDCSLDLMYFWPDTLKNIIKKYNKPDWDIYQLFSSYYQNLKEDYYSSKKWDNSCHCTVTYIINRKGMKKFIDFVTNDNNYNEIIFGKLIDNKLYPPNGYADHFIYDIVNTYTVNIPLVTTQIDVVSTINDPFTSDNSEYITYVYNVIAYYIEKNNIDIKKIFK